MRNLISIIMLLVTLSNFQSLFAITYYVSKDSCAIDSNNGFYPNCNNGGNNGPLSTIQEAINRSSSGDTIKILTGNYYETLTIENKNTLTIEPYGDGNVLISGAIETLTIPNNGNWTYEGTRTSFYHQNNFKVYTYTYPPGFHGSSSPWKIMANYIVDNKDSLLWTYPDKTVFDLHHVNANNGRGAYFTEDTIYLALENNADNPNSQVFFVSSTFPVLEINNSKNITIDGGASMLLEFNHAPYYNIYIHGGNSSMNENNVLKRLKVFNGHTGIYISSNQKNTTIEACEISSYFNSKWTWFDVKRCEGNAGGGGISGCTFDRSGNEINYIDGDRTMEYVGIFFEGTRNGHAIKNNKIHNLFDGISVTGKGIDIFNNVINNTYDDAIEFDNSQGQINCFNNYIYDTYVGISAVPVEHGPIYFYENVVLANKEINWFYNFNTTTYSTSTNAPFKIYGNNSSLQNSSFNCHFYYNTFYNPFNAALKIGGSTYRSKNMNFYNNIFYSVDKHVVEGTGKESDTIDIDNNIFYSERNISSTTNNNFLYWNGYTNSNNYQYLPNLPANWTANIEADPLFVGGASPDSLLTFFKLTSNSPARTINGMTLKPIPSSWHGATVLNTLRTNVGAFEYGSTVSVEEKINPIVNISDVYPNPSNGFINIEIETNTKSIAEINIYNVYGQLIRTENYIITSDNNKLTINLSSLVSGLYLAKLTLNTKNTFHKIYINH